MTGAEAGHERDATRRPAQPMPATRPTKGGVARATEAVGGKRDGRKRRMIHRRESSVNMHIEKRVPSCSRALTRQIWAVL